MKKITLTFFLLISVIAIYSQVKEWGPKQTAKNGVLNPDCLISSDENNYYVLSGLTSKSEIMTFGLDHKLVKSEPVSFNTDLKLKNQKLIRTSEGIFLLMFAKIKAEKRKAYYVSKFENGSFNKDITELDKLDKLIGGFNTFEDEGDQFDRTTTGYKMSKNRKFLLLFKRSKEGFINAVYNADFSLYSYKVVPYKKLVPTSLVDFTEFQVDNNGNVIYTFRKKENNILTDFWYTVLSKDKELEKIQLDLKGKVIKDASIVNNEENELLAVGVFKDASRSNKTGVFTKNISQNSEFVTSYFTEKVDRIMKTSPRGRNNHIVNSTFYNKENMYMTIEQKYVVKSYKTNKDGSSSEVETKHNNNIYLIKFDKSGKAIESSIISKSHNGDNGDVKIIRNNSDIYFIYNQDKSSIKLGKEFKTEETLVSVYSISNDSIKTIKAIEVEGVPDFIKPKYAYVVSNKKLMLKREEGLKSYYFTILNL